MGTNIYRGENTEKRRQNQVEKLDRTFFSFALALSLFGFISPFGVGNGPPLNDACQLE